MTQTTRIKYVGKKESEDAFRADTGLIWFPGSVHDIAAPVAARMLKHPDVFARADQEAPAVHVAAELAPSGKPTKNQVQMAMALLATVGLAVVDPNAMQAGSLNGVALPLAPASLDPSQSNAGNGEANTGATNTAQGGPGLSDKVTETATNAGTDAANMTLAPGGTVGTAQATAKPAAKTSGKGK